jgi:hypothetical protein
MTRDASARKPIDASTLDAARVFLSRVAERYRLHEAILFGSRARGTHGEESDADIAVVLDGGEAERPRCGAVCFWRRAYSSRPCRSGGRRWNFLPVL